MQSSTAGFVTTGPELSFGESACVGRARRRKLIDTCPIQESSTSTSPPSPRKLLTATRTVGQRQKTQRWWNETWPKHSHSTWNFFWNEATNTPACICHTRRKLWWRFSKSGFSWWLWYKHCGGKHRWRWPLESQRQQRQSQLWQVRIQSIRQKHRLLECREREEDS